MKSRVLFSVVLLTVTGVSAVAEVRISQRNGCFLKGARCPMAGKVVSRFSTSSEGIDVSAPVGTPIRAVQDG